MEQRSNVMVRTTIYAYVHLLDFKNQIAIP